MIPSYRFSFDVDRRMMRKALIEGGALVSTREAVLHEQGMYMKQGKDYPMYVIPEMLVLTYLCFGFTSH